MEEREKGLSLNDMLFVALVRDFESMAMVGFGKLVDPVSQTAERNLERAKVAIDMLGMLEEKTRGNLNDTEVALVQQVLTNLRLNYVDELEKEKAGCAEEAGKSGASETPSESSAETKDEEHSEGTKPEDESVSTSQAPSESENPTAEGKKGTKRGAKTAAAKKPDSKGAAGGGKQGGRK